MLEGQLSPTIPAFALRSEENKEIARIAVSWLGLKWIGSQCRLLDANVNTMEEKVLKLYRECSVGVGDWKENRIGSG